MGTVVSSAHTPISAVFQGKGPSFTSATSLWSCVGAFNTWFKAYKLSLAHTDPSLVGTGFPVHAE